MASLARPPRYKTLDQWLAWQKRLHPRAIDLGLERVVEVIQRLGLQQPNYCVITVGGTNGKGSAVAFLDAILRAAGYRVGVYTSPHLLRYNERIRINGVDSDDDHLCQAFAAVDAARADISLSYFEFGTLAALYLFEQTELDVVVLEVGLGGRLDAVNALDADVAIVTSIAIDHSDWLGSDRDSIGFEKAGIFRARRPAICADPDPPPRLLDHAQHCQADIYRVHQDYDFARRNHHWCWWSADRRMDDLPLPQLQGDHQLGNAAAALMALLSLAQTLPLTLTAIRQGLVQAHLPGRFQIIAGAIEWVLDVGHNPHSAAALAAALRTRACAGRTLAIFGMLSDKDSVATAQALAAEVNHWHVVSLPPPRGLQAAMLAEHIQQAGVEPGRIAIHADVKAACQAVEHMATASDRVLVCGSSYTVAAVMQIKR